MSGKRLVIAVDGPAGAGKSTVARDVARRLGFVYIDTGAMYRAIALKALSTGLDLDDQAALAALMESTAVEFQPAGTDGRLRVLLDGRDVTSEIRQPHVDAVVARVAAAPGVRDVLVGLQRRLAARGGVVLDGRDVGTYVLPGADRKFFLTAARETRVERRYRQLRDQGLAVTRHDVERELAERDRRDEERSFAPLRPAGDAVIIDSTEMEITQVIEFILVLCQADRSMRSAAATPAGT